MSDRDSFTSAWSKTRSSGQQLLHRTTYPSELSDTFPFQLRRLFQVCTRRGLQVGPSKPVCSYKAETKAAPRKTHPPGKPSRPSKRICICVEATEAVTHSQADASPRSDKPDTYCTHKEADKHKHVCVSQMCTSAHVHQPMSLYLRPRQT